MPTWTPSKSCVDGQPVSWRCTDPPGFIDGPFQWCNGDHGWAYYPVPGAGFWVVVLTDFQSHSEQRGVATLEAAQAIAEQMWAAASPEYRAWYEAERRKERELREGNE